MRGSRTTERWWRGLSLRLFLSVDDEPLRGAEGFWLEQALIEEEVATLRHDAWQRRSFHSLPGWASLKMIQRPEICALDDADAESRTLVDARFHAELRRQLTRAVRTVCPKWLAEDAEDLVQDSLIRLIKGGKLSDDSELSSAYLKKVAYSAVVDEIRRRRRRLDGDGASGRVELDNLADESPAAASDGALGKAIETCLDALRPDRKRALTLHLLGYSGPEAARVLGCNAKRAENLTYRGLAQLRQFLTDRGLQP